MLRRWKQTATCCVAAAVGLVLVATSPARAKKPDVQLKVATVAPEGSAWMRVMRQIDREVALAGMPVEVTDQWTLVTADERLEGIPEPIDGCLNEFFVRSCRGREFVSRNCAHTQRIDPPWPKALL